MQRSMHGCVRGWPVAIALPLLCAASLATAQNFADAPISTVNYRLTSVVPQVACGALAGRLNDEVTVDSAVLVPAANGVPPFCQVMATGTTQVRMEIALPAAWNRRLYMQGNGGFAGENLAAAGRVNLRNQALANGFVALQTNTGHEAGTAPVGSWAANHPELIIDFAHRAVHLTNQAGRQLAERYYGREPSYAYWNACSTGGRQALMTAQRYPADFDGYVGNAPVRNWTDTFIGFAWNQRALDEAPLTTGKATTAFNAVMSKCDALDGLTDGRIVDARVCSLVFDPDRDLPACTAGRNDDSCLTPAQVGTLKKIWGGPIGNGRRFFPGFSIDTEPAQLQNWMLGTATTPAIERNYATGHLTYFAPYPATDTSAFSLASFNFDTDPLRQDAFRALFDANSTDLSAFRARGGKFISVHGGSDPALTPYMSIEYFDRLQAAMGNTSDFFRLYIDPGMAHCSGGTNGADTFDLVTPLINWVEAGIPPDTIRATKLDTNGSVRFTRKLCPYPQQERYVGGDPNVMTSFTCEVPRPLVAELAYGSSAHYFLSANVTEAYDVASGKVGTQWRKTGTLWNAWTLGTEGTLPVYRFYYPSTVEGGAHFYTLDESEANALRNASGPWIFEGAAFAARPIGSCQPGDVVLTRYYKGDASTGNLPRHRYVASEAAGAELFRQGWVREGAVMCLARFGA